MELMCVVVVPARNEQQRIAGCLQSLAGQGLPLGSFETIVVIDDCCDATEEVATRTAAALGLTVKFLRGPGAGVGPARKVGMDAAAQRLLEAGGEQGLIATTDADSRPAPDWLARQIAHVETGARAIAGMIELNADEAARLPGEVRRRRAREAAARLQQVRVREPDAAHHHFAGASLGVTVATYLGVGGLVPTVALEDAAFAERLHSHGVPVLRASDVVVRTSARTEGRARRGLAVDLAVSVWAERRRYRAEQFTLQLLRAQKGSTSVSVVIPTKECVQTIGGVLKETVRPIAEAGLIDELVVVDGCSADGTAAVARAAGARVLQQDELLTEYGPVLGKGDAMSTPLRVKSSASSTATRATWTRTTCSACWGR